MRLRVAIQSRVVLLLTVLALSMVAIVAVACAGERGGQAPAPAPAAPAAPAPPSAAAAPAAPAPAAPAAPAAAPAAPLPAASAPAAAPEPAPAAATAAAVTAPRAVVGAAVNSLGRDYWLANAAETPKRGGILRSADTGFQDVHGFDIHFNGMWRDFASMLFESPIRMALLEDTGAHDLRPGVADYWDQPDANSIIIHLRSGIFFQDGTELDAEALKWNLNRMATEDLSPRKSTLSHVASIDVLNDYTVKLNIPNPTATALTSLASTLHLQSQKAFETMDEAVWRRAPYGTGPLKLKKHVPDLIVETEVNPNYWRDGVDGKRLPYIDGHKFTSITEKSVVMAELKTNQLDMYDLIAPHQVPEAKQDKDINLFELTWTGTRRPMIGFNMEEGIFTDVRLRQAAQYALDRESQAKTFGENARVWYWPFTYPGWFDWDPDLPHYDYNPEKAKQLVCEVDPDCQVEVELIHIAREPDYSMGLVIQEMWNQVGLKTLVSPVAWTPIADRIYGTVPWEALFWRSSQKGLDPDSDFESVQRGNRSNYANNITPGLSECWQSGREELDQTKRKDIYQGCHRLWYDGAGTSVSFIELNNWALRKEVKGYGVERNRFHYFHEIWLDR